MLGKIVEDNAGIQGERGVLELFREQARSYRKARADIGCGTARACMYLIIDCVNVCLLIWRGGCEVTAKSRFHGPFERLTIVVNWMKVTYPNQTGV